MEVNNILGICAAVLAMGGAFYFFFNRGRKYFYEKKKVGLLSYNMIVNDMKSYITNNRPDPGASISMQLLANDAVLNLRSFLANNNIDISIQGNNNVAMVISKNEKPIYVCIYNYSKLDTDIKDIFSSNDIFSQVIEC